MNRPATAPHDTAAARKKLIIALDFEMQREAEAVVPILGNGARFYKIGLELAYGGGLSLARDDSKRQEGLSRSQAARYRSHGEPGRPRNLPRGARRLPLLGVTVLTSYNAEDLAEAGYAYGVADLVARRAAQAREAAPMR
ncbi:MAG TPA: hypothetical protein VNY06_04600 [Methylocella sp.]|nr:hypothetical protein [Methylocella sp.]